MLGTFQIQRNILLKTMAYSERLTVGFPSMNKREDHSEMTEGLSDEQDEDDCFAAEKLSEIKKLTSTLQSCLSFLFTSTGLKMQIKGTTPEGWINLNLMLTKEIPVELLNKIIPFKSSSISEAKKDIKMALTFILLLKKLLKNVEIKSNDENPKESVDHLLAEVKSISTKIIAKYAIIEKDFLELYRDLVKTVNKLKESFISKKWSAKFPDNVIQTTEEELFFEVLGFGPKLAQALQLLDEYGKHHQNVFYYIRKWVNSYRCVNPQSSKGIAIYAEGVKLERALEAFTFSTETAGIIRNTIASDIQKTQPVKYWVLKYTSQLISSHTLLSEDACVGYQPDIIDAWFTQSINRDKKYKPKKIHMRNVSENSKFTENDIIRHCRPKTKLWYHGTNTFEGADSILNQGIELAKGENMQDFSDMNGFYVTDSFKAARKFARRCSTNGYAVVVFESNIDSTRWKVLDLADRNETWRQVTRYYRSGGEKEEELTVSISDEFNQEDVSPNNTIQIPVDELDCIKGSICSDTEKILDDNNTDIPMYIIDGLSVKQMCVKQDSLAKHFGSLENICAVLWYSGLTNDQESNTSIPKPELMRAEESKLHKNVSENSQKHIQKKIDARDRQEDVKDGGCGWTDESSLFLESDHLKEQKQEEDDMDCSEDDDTDDSQEDGPSVKYMKKELSDIVYGGFETQVSEGGEADLHKHYNSCKKNPGHTQFVPFNDFNIRHLPEGYNNNDIFYYIKTIGDLTVRVTVEMTSKERPEFLPNTKEPYPFYEKRGSDVMRAGTGWVRYVNIKNNEGTCPCHKCQHCDTHSTVWGTVGIYTATHVVFDDLEARHTTCRLFYDRKDSPLVTLDGWTVERANIEADWCRLKCETCDVDLLNKLYKMRRHSDDQWEKVWGKYKRSKDKLTWIVSHPHGCPKQISVGNWIDRYNVSDTRTKYTYTTCTCPGSSGAYVHPLGYGVGWSYGHQVHSGVNSEGRNFSCAGPDCGQFDI